jgi:hypothetical protein
MIKGRHLCAIDPYAEDSCSAPVPSDQNHYPRQKRTCRRPRATADLAGGWEAPKMLSVADCLSGQMLGCGLSQVPPLVPGGRYQ